MRTIPATFSPRLRISALSAVESHIDSQIEHFEGADALQPFFRRLAQSLVDATPIHVLQYGDSHTASDDWADAMRQVFQTNYGYGGPGFTVAGHPYKGYRRFDIAGTSSAGWVTAGTVGHQGDGRNGLAGVSITAQRAGETVTLTAASDQVELYYLQQPGGGSVTISSDGFSVGTISTDGPFANGIYTIPATPGQHSYLVTTTSDAPVRLLGWVSQNNRGVTWETLGINGAQARMMLGWDQAMWQEQLQRRDPALVVIAYGTNEALYPKWTAESYRADLLETIQKLKQSLPDASLLLIGPPDCGRARPFPFLNQVIEIQREIARRTKCAFWDWRSHMDASGGREQWVRAGLSQPDYTHLTSLGYRLLGKTIADDLLAEYGKSTSQPSLAQAGTVLSTGNSGASNGIRQ